MNTADTKTIDAVIKKYGARGDALLSMLHEIQAQLGCISEHTAAYLSTKLCIPVSRIFGAASYYKAFSLEKKGKYQIKVCTGTSCHTRKGSQIFDRLGKELKTSGEGTSEDRQFSLEKVRCLGCCDVGPTMKIGNTTHGNITQRKAVNLIKQYRENS